MALVEITIDFDLHQLLGADFDARRTKAYVTTNVESGTLMDTSTGETRLGDEAVTIAADGTGSFTTWATGADGNPISWQTSLVVDYPRTGQRDRKRRVFGPWTLTAADDGKNITALEVQQAVPAEYLTTVTTQLQTYVDSAQAASTASAAGAQSSAASATLAQTLVTSDLGTTDGQSFALVSDPNSQTGGELRETFVAIAEAPPMPQQYRQPGDPDWTLAFGRLFAAGKSAAFVPPSTAPYDVTSTIVQPNSMHVEFDRGATIRATAAIAGALWQTSTSETVRKSLHGGTFDCNGLAAVGVNLFHVGHFVMDDVTVLSPTGDFVIVGDTAAAGSSYEAEINNLNCYRASVIAGSRGIWLNKGNDNRVNGGTVVNADTGVRAEVSGDNICTDVHVWSWPTGGTIGFDDNGSNRWVACQVDDPGLYGFRLRQAGSVLVAPQVYLSDITPDNVVTGIHSDAGTFSATGCAFVAADPAHRFAGDFNTLSGSTVNVIRSTNVAVRIAEVGRTYTPTFQGTTVLLGDPGDQMRLTAAAGTQYLQHDDMLAFTAVNSGTVRAKIGTDGGVSPGWNGAVGGAIYSGSGVPSNALGANGDSYFRTDTPGTVNQRLYVKAAGTWTGVL